MDGGGCSRSKNNGLLVQCAGGEQCTAQERKKGMNWKAPGKGNQRRSATCRRRSKQKMGGEVRKLLSPWPASVSPSPEREAAWWTTANEDDGPDAVRRARRRLRLSSTDPRSQGLQVASTGGCANGSVRPWQSADRLRHSMVMARGGEGQSWPQRAWPRETGGRGARPFPRDLAGQARLNGGRRPLSAAAWRVEAR